jgi:cytochrome c-type biogenesis protein CcmE
MAHQQNLSTSDSRPATAMSSDAKSAAGAKSARARTLKIIGSGVVVLGALAYLMYATVASGAEYYKHVDEVVANPQAWAGKRLQLHGFARDLKRSGTRDFAFDVEWNGKRIAATYSGIVPDTFKEGAEVVVKGRLQSDNHLASTEVVAKCPSKYEAAPPGATHPADIPK